MRLLFALALACGLIARAQTPRPFDPPKTDPPKAEPAGQEEPLFRSRVNLVMVPVVVRDRQGRTVGNLKQEDFVLLDKGKPQTISRFTIETSVRGRPKEEPAAEGVKAAAAPSPLPADVVPERFVAYLFDDVHAAFADLVRVRDAAWEHMKGSLGEGDRAAIYTTSGQTTLEFTDDLEKLSDTLLKMQPHPLLERGFQDCPDVSHYQADLIENRMDPGALNVAIQEVMACGNIRDRRTAEGMARSAARRVLGMGDQESRIALSVLREVVRRMAATPGQRVILLASPGFVTTTDRMAQGEIIDRAIKANVTINALDARGLWVDSMFDASRRVIDMGSMREKAQIEHQAQSTSVDVLADLAYGTGGTLFQNSNDLAGGFRKLADIPEHLYVLGFSPQNLKLDGGFHGLKVTVRAGAEKLTASARRGYYAPKQLADSAQTAREEIREAVFSREELRELPLEVTTGFADGLMWVNARVELAGLRFRQEEGRSRNTLTVVQTVFDRNGNFVKGKENRTELNLRDEVLKTPKAGMNVKTTFELPPGAYLVRVVVRESEDQHMAAVNSSVGQ